MGKAKISIIGAGNVGRETAVWCAVKELGDIVLWNRTAETAIGNALDIMEAAPIADFDTKIAGTGNLKQTKKSDLVILTAGVPRKAGQTREQLVEVNAKVVYSLVEKLARFSPKSVIITVTNPLDAMAYLAYKASKFPSSRVIGMAGILDSSRFSAFVAKELGISTKEIESIVMGSHGEDMVPLPRFSTVNGVPISNLLSAAKIKKIEAHTKNAGAEIVRLLGSNASISTGAAVTRMAEAILHNERALLPCSCYLNGEYGIRDLYIGVPAIIGAKGVEKIVKLALNAEERARLHKAAARIREVTEIAKNAI